MSEKESVEKTVFEIRQKTHKKYTAEEKIWIILEVLRGEALSQSYVAAKASTQTVL